MVFWRDPQDGKRGLGAFSFFILILNAGLKPQRFFALFKPQIPIQCFGLKIHQKIILFSLFKNNIIYRKLQMC